MKCSFLYRTEKNSFGPAELARLEEVRLAPAGNDPKNDRNGSSPARPLASFGHALAIGLTLLAPGELARSADTVPQPQTDQSSGATQATQDATSSFMYGWDVMKASSADQPNWAAPLNTVTPLLKEFVMYGQALQTLPNGANVDLINGGMPALGIHLIPDYYNEVYIGTPTEEVRMHVKPASGLTDMPFFLLKTRLIAANKDNGDYVVSAYLSGQTPIGAEAFTNNAYYITPTIGAGKGWGDFNIQVTVGTPWPLSHLEKLGGQLAANVAFQFHLLEYLWPELELNNTYWFNGPRRGFDQLFLSPNIIFGPYPLPGTIVKASLIVGYQTALTPHPQLLNPITPLYKNGWQFAVRLFF